MFVASPEDLSHGKCRSVRGELIMMVTWYLAASLDGGGGGEGEVERWRGGCLSDFE